MSLNFSNSTGNFFNQLGADLDGIVQTESFQKITLPAVIGNGTLGIIGNYLSWNSLIPTLQASLVNGQNAAQQFKTDMATISNSTLIGRIQADTPQPQASVAYAMPELITQMNAASATVLQNVVGGSIANGTNYGNGTCVTSLTLPTGIVNENIYAENIAITCTRDSQPGGGATAGQELFLSQGEPFVSQLSYLWPGGSGGSVSIIASSAAVTLSQQNLLNNSNFTTFSNGTPGSWIIATGTPNGTVSQTASGYIGQALVFNGNGSELTKITQTIRDVANGTIGIITPQTKYCLAFYLESPSVPAAGVLRVSLQDGGGNITASSNISVTLSGITTSYVLYTHIFDSPLSLPPKLSAVIELTTAISNAKSIYIDEMVITAMTQHQNGPFFAIIPGNLPFVRNDSFAATMTNTYAGQFQTLFWRVFRTDNLNPQVVLPSASAGNNTISDSLIT